MGAAIASRMRGPPNLLRKSAPPRPAGAAATRSLTRSPGAHVPVLPHNFVQTTGEAYASRSVSNTQIHQRNRRSGKAGGRQHRRSEEHTSEHQSLMRISYAVLRLKKKK